MTISHPSFGKLDDTRIIIFDTTLRDGEQSPGFSMNLAEKLRMAEALAELGVDVIEAGFPIASPGDFESVGAMPIARTGEGPGDLRPGPLRPRRHHARRRGGGPGRAQAHPHLHQHQPAAHEIQAAHGARRGAGGGDRQRDAGAPVHRRRRMVGRGRHPHRARLPVPLHRSRDRAGATTINIPDTVGYALPEDMARIFTMLRARVPGAERVIFSTHNHNDLGLAVANTIAAVRAGVRQIECTINGIGERAGNAALEEIVMAIRTRPDAVPCRHNVVTPKILRTSRLLSTITGFDVQPNKAIVGRNAFAHESGIHQDGVLKNAATYEIMTPESVGWTKSNLVMGKHSGRAAFRDKLRALGYGEIGDNQLNDAFRRFKELADRKKIVYDEDICALVDDEVMRDHTRIRFVSLDVHAGSRVKPTATLELEIDGVVLATTAAGDGPVDATFIAIRQLFPHESMLRLFSVGAVTEGTDAQAQMTVRLEEDGKLVDGQGADTDTIVAAARAYVHALNKLLVKRARTEPEALSA